jgi:hypothetical protein
MRNVGALTKRMKSQLERQERKHPESTQRIGKAWRNRKDRKWGLAERLQQVSKGYGNAKVCK